MKQNRVGVGIGILATLAILVGTAMAAFNGAVTNWVSNWSEDGTNVTVAIASFPELSAAEADATTGDIRDVMYAVVDKFYDEYVSKSASTNQPTRVTIARSSSVNPTGTDIVYTYTFKFTVSLTPGEVADE